VLSTFGALTPGAAGRETGLYTPFSSVQKVICEAATKHLCPFESVNSFTGCFCALAGVSCAFAGTANISGDARAAADTRERKRIFTSINCVPMFENISDEHETK
jgi:hypothetical protein